MWRKLVAALSAVLMLGGIAAGGGAYLYRRELLAWAQQPLSSTGADRVTVTVPRGATPREVARLLADHGVVADAAAFERYLRFVARKADALKAGEYELAPDMSPDEIIALLGSGRRPTVRVTLPEGLRKEEVIALLADKGLSSRAALDAALASPELRAAFGAPNVPGGLDGYLFPDTYEFDKGTPADKILLRLRARLDEVMDAPLRARMRELDWDLHKTLTLAAIVEKETAQPEERSRIAAVFVNRLKKGMKLQTDPTVIYGIPDYDGDIRRADLLRPHPYNTYVIAGLPPGPIAQPGLAAIRAALFPLTTNELYFVAKGDSGSHEFCPTLDCHNAAVQKWQVDFRKKIPRKSKG